MTCRRWIGVLTVALWSAGWMTPGSAQAATGGFSLAELKLQSAGDLVKICTIEPTHEDYVAGLAFCYGFFEGTIRYAEAIAGSESGLKLVCPPPGTTRLQAVEVFVVYMKEHSQYASDGPVDGIYRALMPHWPCPEQS